MSPSSLRRRAGWVTPSSSSKRQSRDSPSPKQRSSSPVPTARARRAARRQDVDRQRSRSPSPDVRSRSPSPPRPRSRSPAPTARARHASTRSLARSPSPDRRSRSPSPPRTRSPAPMARATRSRTRSPSPDRRSHSASSPARSPATSRRHSTNTRRHRSRSPSPAPRLRAPSPTARAQLAPFRRPRRRSRSRSPDPRLRSPSHSRRMRSPSMDVGIVTSSIPEAGATGDSGCPSSVVESQSRGLVEYTTPAKKGVRDGRTKIWIDGYEFTRATATMVKISYRCSYYRGQNCPGKIVFYASIMDYEYANAVPHTCTPPGRIVPGQGNADILVHAEMRREVDRLAIASDDPSTLIWERVSDMFYPRGTAQSYKGMSKPQVKARVDRVRNVHFGLDIHGRVEVPPLSRVKHSTLNFFQFHHLWTASGSKKEFGTERCIGWAHPGNIHLLRYENISLFIDGTFRCVPRQFKQCVVVMVYDRGSKLFVPVFFVLTTSKTHDTYWNLLQYICDACGERMSPKQIVCDFEAALVNTISDWFKVKPTGCFFHFKQACQRKMVKYRVPKDQIDIAMARGVLDQLTNVDPSKIMPHGVRLVKREIKTKCQEASTAYSTRQWGKFWAYFEKTWTKMFPPDIWNVFGMRRDTVARTNNPLERFNRELNATFSTPHPSIARFVKGIEEISRRYVKLRDDISRGLAQPPKRDTRADLPPPFQLPDLDSDSESESEEEEAEESYGESSSESGDDNDVDIYANNEGENEGYWSAESEVVV